MLEYNSIDTIDRLSLERSIICGLLANPAKIEEVSQKLDFKCFEDLSCKTVYIAILQMSSTQILINGANLEIFLSLQNKSVDIGGADGISQWLAETADGQRSFDHTIDLLIDIINRRQIIAYLNKFVYVLLDRNVPLIEIQEMYEKAADCKFWGLLTS